MDQRIYCALRTLYLKGEAAEEPLSWAVYVRFYASKFEDKQEKQVTHTYNLHCAKLRV